MASYSPQPCGMAIGCPILSDGGNVEEAKAIEMQTPSYMLGQRLTLYSR